MERECRSKCRVESVFARLQEQPLETGVQSAVFQEGLSACLSLRFVCPFEAKSLRMNLDCVEADSEFISSQGVWLSAEGT